MSEKVLLWVVYMSYICYDHSNVNTLSLVSLLVEESFVPAELRDALYERCLLSFRIVTKRY